MTICITIDTRPTIVKVSPIARELSSRNVPFFLAHTGQHYSFELSRMFLDQLQMPEPKYNLGIGSGSQAEQVGKALIGFEKVFLEERPRAILIHGDANMVPAASLAAVKCGFTAIHLEAGLRSYNRAMPEEYNRVIADHICDYLYTPTTFAKEILKREGIPDDRVFVTGNTIVDAIEFNRGPAQALSLKLPPDYILLTLHRSENVDDPKVLAVLVSALERLADRYHWPIFWPIHPRSQNRLDQFGLTMRVARIPGMEIIPPTGYFEFLKYILQSRLVLTDSGGVQEEACTLHVPCVTLRTETERPESVQVGANAIAGVSDPEAILAVVSRMLDAPREWANPFGDGRAAEAIVKTTLELIG